MENKIEIDKEDFVEILKSWYWGMEYNEDNIQKFEDMLSKYNISIEKIL